MRRTSEDRDLYDWDANESEEQTQSSLISRAEQNISSSCQHLEQTFKDINRDFDAPCPVKLIRRLTSLEIALSQLKKDCETISSKRKSIVQSVISDQNENVGHVAKIAPMGNLGSSSEYRQDSMDSNWKELSLEMKVQLDIL
mmetsp:Transcript_7632/g.18708  ORF Transcript_7632/g.18708 Transcript_7632/m.18708 type:complete len:142 (+) Transcript_7632:165-590(+)|eukprot:CAMPEP_0116091392 /NCGR_PEP_ID=MMETSP0327-20121206/7482_1 /TAXON_ID=44447 /ORGANISM="Pseudo-nitzschia delicatissima, Strain B596" /LENGTH=141 /DNA_ID=CAMNT_0003582743 /DNA_START=177 /DNA_END=602 /DNA_ORIENTATION=+